MSDRFLLCRKSTRTGSVPEERQKCVCVGKRFGRRLLIRRHATFREETESGNGDKMLETESVAGNVLEL